MRPTQLKDESKVVVIGAGIGGIIAAIALKQQLGLSNFVIYEKANEVGGTWRDNTYPGCSCDIPIHLYSLSTDLNPEWSSTHCYNDEIQAYWRGIADKYSIRPHIVFDTFVSGLVWDVERQVWVVTTVPVKGGQKEIVEAKVVISALGILEVPQYPKEIKGLDNFKGEMFHSARWNWNFSLKGKRVAVIGNGASASQFVPRIAEEDGIEVVHFSRTPNWYLPSTRMEYPKYIRWMFRHIPYSMRLVRVIHFWSFEIFYFTAFYSRFLNGLLAKYSKKYMKATAPPEYVNWLIPNYVLACKRVIFDSGYLGVLKRENVTLNTNGIQRIEEKGIVTKNGEVLDFDVIIFATGFQTNDYPIEARGTDKSTTLRDYYISKGGPIAYRGTAVPGFPNFFLVSGPNTITGHLSVIYTTEVQINYIMKLLRPIMNGVISSLQVTPKAMDAYNQVIQKRLAKSVFTACTSWYRKDGRGKVTSIWPGSATRFWLWLYSPDLDHYSAVPSRDGSALGNKPGSIGKWESYKRKQKILGLCSTAGWLLVLTTAAVAWWKPEVLGKFVSAYL